MEVRREWVERRVQTERTERWKSRAERRKVALGGRQLAEGRTVGTDRERIGASEVGIAEAGTGEERAGGGGGGTDRRATAFRRFLVCVSRCAVRVSRALPLHTLRTVLAFDVIAESLKRRKKLTSALNERMFVIG